MSASFRLEVTAGFNWHGGYLSGGGTLRSYGSALIDGANATDSGGFGLTDAARLELYADSEWMRDPLGRSWTMTGGDGITVWNQGTMAMDTGLELLATSGPNLTPLTDDGRGISWYTAQPRTSRPILGGRMPIFDNLGTIVVSELATGGGSYAGNQRSTIGFYFNNINNDSSIEIGRNGNGEKLELAGGGASAMGTMDVAESATLSVSNFSMVLAQPPAFVLSSTAPLEIVGEEQGEAKVDNTFPDRTDSTDPLDLDPYGTYKLRVRSGPHEQITSCIPYHATAYELRMYLEALPLVMALGGVTVYRDGDAKPGAWGNGYRYRIDFDAAPDRIGRPWQAGTSGSADWEQDGGSWDLTIPEVELHCQGTSNLGCDCKDTVSPLEMNGDVRYFCGILANTTKTSTKPLTLHQITDPVLAKTFQASTITDPNTCTIVPTFGVDYLIKAGEAKIKGGGTLEVTGGVHRIPSLLDVDLTMTSGTAAVVATNVTYTGHVRLEGDGLLIAAGSSFQGLDQTQKLWEGPARSGYARSLTPCLAGLCWPLFALLCFLIVSAPSCFWYMLTHCTCDPGLPILCSGVKLW